MNKNELRLFYKSSVLWIRSTDLAALEQDCTAHEYDCRQRPDHELHVFVDWIYPKDRNLSFAHEAHDLLVGRERHTEEIHYRIALVSRPWLSSHLLEPPVLHKIGGEQYVRKDRE